MPSKTGIGMVVSRWSKSSLLNKALAVFPVIIQHFNLQKIFFYIQKPTILFFRSKPKMIFVQNPWSQLDVNENLNFQLALNPNLSSKPKMILSLCPKPMINWSLIGH